MIRLSADGDIETEYGVPMQILGSYSSSVQVCNVWAFRSQRGNPVPPGFAASGTYVYISGNPAKFLQGHNIYGTDNLSELSRLFFGRVAEALGFDKATADMWRHVGRSGRYELTRIDITYNYRVEGGSASVNDWIRAAHNNSRASHKNAGVLRGNTLYFGKHSRRHTIKIYNKRQDLDAHPPCPLLREAGVFAGVNFNDVWDLMHDDADGLLRVEQTFRGRKLRDMGYEDAREIDMGTIRKMFDDGMDGLTISGQVPNSQISKESVGRGAYSAYLAWKCGELDCSKHPRNTVWRHRRSLLPYGVDITLPRQEGNDLVVVPLVRVLEAVPVDAPDWYRRYNLLAA
jgi:II/X family phage/plasmid replication protein